MMCTRMCSYFCTFVVVIFIWEAKLCRCTNHAHEDVMDNGESWVDDLQERRQAIQEANLNFAYIDDNYMVSAVRPMMSQNHQKNVYHKDCQTDTRIIIPRYIRTITGRLYKVAGGNGRGYQIVQVGRCSTVNARCGCKGWKSCKQKYGLYSFLVQDGNRERFVIARYPVSCDCRNVYHGWLFSSSWTPVQLQAHENNDSDTPNNAA